ncbi:MAG: hypothetical protein WC690_02985, partial [bacterium]
SGLAEVILKRSLDALGIKAPMNSNVHQAMKSLERGGVAQYLREGSYIGDNHLMIYNLQAAAVVADEVYHDLAKIHEHGIIRSVPHALKKGLHDQDPVNILRGIKILGAEFEEFAAKIYQDRDSTHPLKPVIHRVAPYLKIVLEMDLSKKLDGERESSPPQIAVGLRSLSRPRGNAAWIEERPLATREVVRLLLQYNDYVHSHLTQLLGSGEVRAIVPLSFMVPDSDLPFVWTHSLEAVELDREEAHKDLFDDIGLYSRPALLPLVLQGYHGQAMRLLPDSQSNLTHAKSWLLALFNGIETASRIGEAKAVEQWMDILEGEASKGWAHRYHLALLEAVGGGVGLTPSGKKMLEALFDGGRVGFVPPRVFIEKLFEIIESTSSEAKADTGDVALVRETMESAGRYLERWASDEEKGAGCCQSSPFTSAQD